LEIFSVFNEKFEGNAQLAKAFIENIVKIKRFDLTVSFLMKKEKIMIKQLFERLYEEGKFDEKEYILMKNLYKIQ